VIVLLLLALALVPHGAHAGGNQVVQVDKTWTCTSKVDLDLVKVTMTRAVIGNRKLEDAVHLRNGCTGRIGRLEIVQWAADGVKIAQGAHDLTVGGGSIRCLGKAPTLHQDGIQALGGARITFHDLTIDCGRQQDRLIDSNFFVNEAGKSTQPPTDIVCDGCWLGGWAAHTVNLQTSVRSGVTDSTLCVARFPKLTFQVGSGAVDPVRTRNRILQCGNGQLTLDRGRRTVVFGRPLVLTGLFLGQAPGSPVSAEERPQGSSRFVPLPGTAHSSTNGHFTLVLRPRVGGTVRLRSGSTVGPVATVHVRPRVLLTRSHGRLVAKVVAGRSYAGRTTMLQALHKGRWGTVRKVVLGRGSKAVFSPGIAGVRVRLAVPATRGYLAATSGAIRL